MQAFKQLKVLHTIFKGTYLEPYLRFLKNFISNLRWGSKYAPNLYLSFI